MIPKPAEQRFARGRAACPAPVTRIPRVCGVWAAPLLSSRWPLTGCAPPPRRRCGHEGESKGKQEAKDSDFIRRRTLEARGCRTASRLPPTAAAPIAGRRPSHAHACPTWPQHAHARLGPAQALFHELPEAAGHALKGKIVYVTTPDEIKARAARSQPSHPADVTTARCCRADADADVDAWHR